MATHYGEDAFISEDSSGDELSRVYFCYEKAMRTSGSSGFLCDIRVMFDSEIQKVRELKLRNQTQGIDEFPVGYTTLKVNTILLPNGKKKNVYLCLKRVGGTKLKSLVSEDGAKKNLQSGSSNILNKLQSITSIAVNEVKDIKRTQNEKRKNKLEAIGVTAEVIETANYLSSRGEIFRHFPLDGHQPKDEFFTMNEKQQQHAIQILKAVPKLGETRRQLAPSSMSDSTFWFIYFTFMKKTIEGSN
eukprot:CAMPEP_0117012054 /NCGR_PEP_ID=MMETSP0472-20121206/10230_1 /TAXON_ID=693140 ORGANISM="Tiarina fusus, Strain LIS" /NCGR_SAMPLE_ID=MMETSP0472 /ASSEMBLY_ACC=CAM_ASM_000603 /LENGTH=244 /DNA_ID=CAMNT_0004715031 /DNA_START=1287 /DNA_END=2021 /DNA_ORIENTATION=-